MADTQWPEHEKLFAVAPQTQAVGEFLEWLAENYHCELGRPEGRNAEFRPVPRTLDELLAEWTGVDLVRLEQEKRAMLDELRAKAEPAV